MVPNSTSGLYPLGLPTVGFGPHDAMIPHIPDRLRVLTPLVGGTEGGQSLAASASATSSVTPCMPNSGTLHANTPLGIAIPQPGVLPISMAMVGALTASGALAKQQEFLPEEEDDEEEDGEASPREGTGLDDDKVSRHPGEVGSAEFCPDSKIQLLGLSSLQPLDLITFRNQLNA